VAKSREIELRLERVEMQLRLYQKISRYLTRNVPLPEALQAIVGLVAEFMRSDSCLLYLVSGDELVLCAAKGSNPGAVGEVKLRLEEGLTGWVARERRVLAISREAYHDSRFKFFRDLPEDSYEAFLSAPVIARGRVAGVINLQHRQPHAHSGDEIEMVATVGEQIGCLVALSAIDIADLDQVNFADLVLAGGTLAGES
jgi:signal transduction protein with GAF and PtsI domain